MHCLTVAPRPCLCARQALGGTGTVPGSPTARLFACQSARMVDSASDLEFAIARHPPGKGPDVRGVKVLIFTVFTFSHVGANQHHCFFRHNCHFGEYHPHLHHHDFRGSVSLKPTYAEKWESILQRFGQYHNTCFCNGHIIDGTGVVNQMYSFADFYLQEIKTSAVSGVSPATPSLTAQRRRSSLATMGFGTQLRIASPCATPLVRTGGAVFQRTSVSAARFVP